jgi:hypothetical protein
MTYDIIVKGYRTKDARMIVARHLARERMIALCDAQEKTNHLPLTIFTAKDRAVAGRIIERFKRFGIDAQAIESDATRSSAIEALFNPQAIQNDRLPSRFEHSHTRSGFMGTEDALSASRKRKITVVKNVAILVGIFIVAGLALFGLSHFTKRYVAVPVKTRGIMTRSAAAQQLPPHDTGREDTIEHPAKSVAAADRKQAQGFLDSATASGQDLENAIRFYTMAIAFNKYNSAAWYGLLDAYHRSGRAADEEKTRRKMSDLFGDRVFSMEAIIRPFGTLNELHEENGTLVVEYRSNAPSVRKKLLHEAYLIYRALRNECGCQTITLFASTSAANGLVAHVPVADNITSAAEFEKRATIHFFRAPAEQKRALGPYEKTKQ